MTRRIEPPRLTLSQLHAAGVGRVDSPNRALASYPFEHENVKLTIEHPSGGDSQYHVCTMNLSTRTVICAHGGYVHPFVSASIELPTAWGTTATREGMIASCWHLRGRIHGLSIDFASRLDIKRHLAPEVLPPESESGGQGGASLSGDCLALLPNELEAQLVASTLAGTSMTLTHACDSGEACDHLRRKPYDALLIEADDERFAANLSAIRATPYHGPVIALTASRRSTTSEDLQEAGADAVIQRPFRPEQILARLLAITDEACEHSGRPVISEYAKDARFRDVVNRYIEEARAQAMELQEAIVAQDAGRAQGLCECLAISGVTFGFPSLTEAADAAATSLMASSSVPESLPELRGVGRLIQRLSFSSECGDHGSPDAGPSRAAA